MTFDDVYEELLSLTSEVGARPDVPMESEQFFSKVVEDFDGTKEECLEHIKNNLHNWFRFVFEEPRWLQEPDWQFLNGKPMVFIGQIEIPVTTGYFHDDASFYVFGEIETGETKVVIQVA